MDVGGRHDFWTAIRQDAAGGRTVIFATHYLEEADAYADRVPRGRCANLSSAIGKTGARTRAEAVRLAVDNGWLLA